MNDKMYFDWKCTHLEESTQDKEGRYHIYDIDSPVMTAHEVYLADGIVIELCSRCYMAMESWVWENR
jgi:hypothetical protein